MRHVVPAVLLLVALIHALPAVGVVGESRLARLYGVDLRGDPDLVLLMRHRAVLFGLLAALLAYAAFQPNLHGLGLAAGWGSVLAFLALARGARPLNPKVAAVVRVDWVASGLLAVGSWAHLA